MLTATVCATTTLAEVKW